MAFSASPRLFFLSWRFYSIHVAFFVSDRILYMGGGGRQASRREAITIRSGWCGGGTPLSSCHVFPSDLVSARNQFPAKRKKKSNHKASVGLWGIKKNMACTRLREMMGVGRISLIVAVWKKKKKKIRLVGMKKTERERVTTAIRESFVCCFSRFAWRCDVM